MEQTLINSSWTIEDVLYAAKGAGVKMTKKQAREWLSSHDASDLSCHISALGMQVLREHLAGDLR